MQHSNTSISKKYSTRCQYSQISTSIVARLSPSKERGVFRSTHSPYCGSFTCVFIYIYIFNQHNKWTNLLTRGALLRIVVTTGVPPSEKMWYFLPISDCTWLVVIIFILINVVFPRNHFYLDCLILLI